jgi:hypothetical protein
VNATATEVAARAGVEIGGELWPMNPLGFVASSSAVVLLWCAALVYRARRWRETPVAEARDVLLILSLVTLAGAFRVGRTLDFFVPFAMLYAGMELTPWIRQNRQRAAHFGAIAMLLCAANVGLAAKSALDSIPVERYRGVAAYLEREAPGELVINAFSSSYYYLYFWNSQNRYFIGIEPTFTYLNAPAEYWTWRHFSNDEPVDASDGQVACPLPADGTRAASAPGSVSQRCLRRGGRVPGCGGDAVPVRLTTCLWSVPEDAERVPTGAQSCLRKAASWAPAPRPWGRTWPSRRRGFCRRR